MLYLQKITEYLLYLFAFLLPFQTRLFLEKGMMNGGIVEYQTISLYVSDIVLVLLLAVFIFYQLKRFRSEEEYNVSPRVIWWLIAGLDLFFFISILVAGDHLLAAYKYGVFLLGAGLFWVLIRAHYSRLKLLFSFLAAMLLQAGVGIWQFLSQSDFGSKWMGKAIHSVAEGGTSVVQIAETGERWLRAYGALPHPNILGGVLAVAILILVGIMVNYELKIKNDGSGITNSYLLPLTSYLFLSIFTTSLFFTFSRGAWLSLLAGLFVFLTLNYFRGKHHFSRRPIKPVVLMGILAAILSFSYGDIVSTRLGGGAELEQKSTSERTASLRDGWRVIGEAPFSGTGAGNYILELHRLDPGGESWEYQPVHNTFLLIWAEIGFAGLLLFVSILAWIATALYRRKDRWGLAVLASLMVILMFEHWLWSLHFGMLLFWFILGIIYKPYREYTNIYRSTNPASKNYS